MIPQDIDRKVILAAIQNIDENGNVWYEEKILKVNEVLVFVNLKQYLSKDELKEFYKYIVYNNLCAVFVDSQTYGIADNMENKIIIDDNLNEFVL